MVGHARLLQSDILGSQEGRRLPSSIRLKSSESLCQQREIQDDHPQSSDQRFAQRRLGSEHRSQRCLLPRPYSCKVQTAVKVRPHRQQRAPCIPIPSPSVWSDFGSTSIYKGNTSVGASSAHARYQSAPISGRLADKKSRQVITLPADRLAARGHASSGVSVKRSKIPLNTYSTHHAHRRGIPSRLRSNVSPDDASSEVRAQDFNSVKNTRDDSILLAVPTRNSEFSNRCYSARTATPDTSAAILARSLETSVTQSQSADTSERRSTRSPSAMLVGQRLYTSRDAARHSRGSGTSVYRCVRVGMGRPPSHTPGEWYLVDEGDKTPHQSIGNDGCTKRLDGLQETVDRYDSATHV